MKVKQITMKNKNKINKNIIIIIRNFIFILFLFIFLSLSLSLVLFKYYVISISFFMSFKGAVSKQLNELASHPPFADLVNPSLRVAPLLVFSRMPPRLSTIWLGPCA